MLSFFNTYIDPSAQEKISEVLSSTFLSEGEVVKNFENELKSVFNFNYISTLNSGTSALHMALDVLNIGEGDEVIIPAQTFIATGLAVLYQKARPVFADINYRDGNINVEDVRKRITHRTRAIICVHWGGYPCDLTALKELCKQHNLFLIEDAAHALGATYKSQPIGNISDVTCFSFQAIKHLTTGDGGAVTCNDENIYKSILTKRWFGINRDTAVSSELGERQYNVNELGYKYHLNNYAAALGLANLNSYEKRLAKRREIAELYSRELQTVSGIKLFQYANDRQSAYWLFGMHVDKRLDFVRYMKSCQIPVSVVHQRIDRNEIFGGLADLPQQEFFDESQIHIPIHDAINLEKASYIVNVIKKGW
jgi:perosamine synthetase